MPGLKRIFSRTGVPIADVRAANTTFSSILNGVGEASFILSTSDPKCKRSILEYGNILLIEHDSLPPWVGVIDTPRSWQKGSVVVKAYEMTHLLKYRPTSQGTTISGSSGSVAGQLVTLANSYGDTMIRLGNMYQGPQLQIPLGDMAYDVLIEIAKQSGNDWVIRPSVGSDGVLSVYMDWLSRAGNPTQLILSDGFNLISGENPYEESGEIINEIHAYNDQQDENPLFVVERDAYSVQAYGPRIKKETFTAADEATLRIAARNELSKTKQPAVAVPLTIVNKGSEFSLVRLGNQFTQVNASVGFSGEGLGQSLRLRIMGYRYEDSTQTCEIYAGGV